MKALEIYRRAEGFYFALHLVNREAIGKLKAQHEGVAVKEKGPYNQLWAPIGMLHGLCLELYLKALILQETGIEAKGHNLEKLFLMLPRGTQLRIQFAYDHPPPLNAAYREGMRQHGFPTDFGECLSLSKNAFVEQRYLYEDQNKNSSMLLDDILSSVREYIYLAYKDWFNSTPTIDLSIPTLSEYK
jgi:hypothetical protein